MKKIILLLITVLCVLSVNAQKGTIAYLNDNPKYGNIILGDSITKNLRKCSLLEEKGNGGFKCKVSELEEECYKMGGITPIVAFVDVDKYLIKNILVYFKIEEQDVVNNYLIKTYGKYDAFEKGTRNWYGKRIFIIAGQSDKGYYVMYSLI